MWRLAVMAVPVTLIFFAAQAVVLAGTRLAHPGDYPDLFAPYEAVMPGQLVTYSDYPCDRQATDHYLRTILCEIDSGSGPFISVSSNIFQDRFVRTVFVADDLHVGDVIWHWGRPDVVEKFNHQTFYLLWNDQGLVGFIDPAGPVGQFSYRLPVEYFTIGLNNPTTIP